MEAELDPNEFSLCVASHIPKVSIFGKMFPSKSKVCDYNQMRNLELPQNQNKTKHHHLKKKHSNHICL